MRKNTEFGYLYRRLEHLERLQKYNNDKYERLLRQLTTVFQRIAILERKSQDSDSKTSKK